MDFFQLKEGFQELEKEKKLEGRGFRGLGKEEEKGFVSW